VPVATENGSMEREYWFTIARNYKGLEDAEAVGRKAAQRAIRRLGAVKVDTQRAPVIFEPRIARSLLGNIFEAVDGRAIYRKASFLAGKLGEKIADERFTLIDDGTLPGLFGSSPFDDEGVPSRRTPVIERGVLKNYLLNTYTARKLNMKTTGNASRGITGNAGIGHGNFFIEAGTRSQEEIIRSVKNGLFVTELIGSGVNTVTGDYSRGAVGMWIRDGELAFPVSEVTIASTLQEMLNGIGEIGNDLEFIGSISAPTIMLGEMTVAGR
jgi:PmbA protein